MSALWDPEIRALSFSPLLQCQIIITTADTSCYFECFAATVTEGYNKKHPSPTQLAVLGFIRGFSELFAGRL